MRITSRLPTFALLLLVLFGALFAHGWGRALPFGTSLQTRDYIAVAAFEAPSLLPVRIAAISALNATEPDTPDHLAPVVLTPAVVRLAVVAAAVAIALPDAWPGQRHPFAPRAPPAA